MQKADLVIRGRYVLPVEGPVIEDGAVAVGKGEILMTGTHSEVSGRYLPARTIGGPTKAVLPGLINTHTHAAMVFLRGIAEDLPLREWLEGHIWPKEALWLSPGFVRDAVELACLEMLKAGITTFNDMYFFEDEAAAAAKALGMRAVLGAGIVDFPTKAGEGPEEYFGNAEGFVERWKGDSLITPAIAPHSLYTCGPENQRRAKEFADRHDIPVHIHLSETKWEVQESLKRYGKTPVMAIDGLGVLSERVLAAHCVWLSDEEIEVLAKKRVGVSHCPESNLKLASGTAPVAKMLKAGVRVSLGTDGAASNNDLDILSEMSTAAKIGKASSGDPTALDAETVLKMATIWGAEALGMGDKTGSLKAGKRADIIVIELEKPHLTPLYNIHSHMLYAVRASDVETVIVDGRIVVASGEILTAEEKHIIQKAARWGEKISGKI